MAKHAESWPDWTDQYQVQLMLSKRAHRLLEHLIAYPNCRIVSNGKIHRVVYANVAEVDPRIAIRGPVADKLLQSILSNRLVEATEQQDEWTVYATTLRGLAALGS